MDQRSPRRIFLSNPNYFLFEPELVSFQTRIRVVDRKDRFIHRWWIVFGSLFLRSFEPGRSKRTCCNVAADRSTTTTSTCDGRDTCAHRSLVDACEVLQAHQTSQGTSCEEMVRFWWRSDAGNRVGRDAEDVGRPERHTWRRRGRRGEERRNEPNGRRRGEKNETKRNETRTCMGATGG